MWIVTGGAGFIGSALVRSLAARGADRVLVVEALDRAPALHNLDGCRGVEVEDAAAFRARLARGGLGAGVDGVLHHGACSDTMETDRAWVFDTNVAFSGELLDACLAARVPLVYASSAAVYGGARAFAEEPANEAPLNLYAESKLAFDREVRARIPADPGSTVVGLRYFNVYGPREGHKGRMASIVHQLARQLRDDGEARLFEGTDGHGPGEQRRDFVHVDDVVAAALHFACGPPRRAIVNVGTGTARSFNAVARALIAELGGGAIRYVPFPERLRGRYQSYTCADLRRLRAAGHRRPATTLEDGVARTLAAEPLA